MEAFSVGVVMVLLSHQIMSAFKFYSVRREEKGLSPREHSRIFEWFQSSLLLLPAVGDAVYQCTLGLIDHLHEKRLCSMLADRDDEIARLRKEIAHQKELVSSCKKHIDFVHEMYHLNDYGFPTRKEP